ncbi:helix-turn-helix protein [Micromonospora sp. Llam0]|uniref:helix-turn-helix domain-containing protein n=1 Tax=Micromonospora sp. Llam0 TaxID=2485143 RepID=UPI000F47EF48|nr:helix-turn-helix protein [Micromonospora sp. Llam0]
MLLRQVIGRVLRRLRQDQGRTLQDVARAAGLSTAYLSELARSRPMATVRWRRSVRPSGGSPSATRGRRGRAGPSAGRPGERRAGRPVADPPLAAQRRVSHQHRFRSRPPR